MQLKRFPLAAGLTIATCRGFLLNFGVYYATREARRSPRHSPRHSLPSHPPSHRSHPSHPVTRQALGLTFLWNPAVSFLARFMTVYACVIAVTKDLPDIEGDKAGGIQTFALTYGAKKVAGGAAAVLLLNYVGAVATALLAAPGTFRRPLMAGGHALAAAWLWRSHRKLDADSPSSIQEFYKQIWNLFYFEYMLYPFI